MKSQREVAVAGRAKIIAVVLAVIIYGAPYAAHRSPGLYSGEVIVPQAVAAAGEGAEFYSTVVNPGAGTPVSHVSTVAGTKEGRIISAWYAGSREGGRDVRIYTSFLDPGAGAWSEPVAVVSSSSAGEELGRYVRKVGNPVLFTDPEGRLWLFYVSVSFGGWSGSSINYKVSEDGGLSWGGSKKLHTSPVFNLSTLVKNKPVFLEGGTFLLPVYHEFARKFPELLAARMEDGGLRYERIRMSGVAGLLQPSIVPDGEGGLVAFFRDSRGGGQRYVMASRSTDNGRTWGAPESTVLPNPNSGLDVAAAPSGRLVMALNDLVSDRWRLSLYVSGDKGVSWTKAVELENEPGMEFSYPSIIRTADGVYHLTYTYDRKHIKHVSFTDRWLDKNVP